MLELVSLALVVSDLTLEVLDRAKPLLPFAFRPCVRIALRVLVSHLCECRAWAFV